MNLRTLLALFETFDRDGVQYRVAGDLGQAIHGRYVLAERLEINVAVDAANGIWVENAFREVWPGIELTPADGLVFRALPPATSFYFEVMAVADLPPGERMQVGDTIVHVVALSAMERVSTAPEFSREGFSLPTRFAAVQSLARELVPQVPRSLGVRRYRSIEAANAERQGWDQERVARIRAERLRQ